MKIGIDIDDTLTNTSEYVMPLIKKYIEDELQRKYEFLEAEKDWYYLSEHLDLTKDEESYCWRTFYHVDNYLPRENAIEVINKLYDEKNEITFITSRCEKDIKDAEKRTIKWLEKYNIKYHKLIMKVENKGEIAKKEKIDVFIDDSIRHCKVVASVGVKTYLITNEYNKFYECKDFERVDSWNDFYKKLI